MTQTKKIVCPDCGKKLTDKFDTIEHIFWNSIVEHVQTDELSQNV